MPNFLTHDENRCEQKHLLSGVAGCLACSFKIAAQSSSDPVSVISSAQQTFVEDDLFGSFPSSAPPPPVIHSILIQNPAALSRTCSQPAVKKQIMHFATLHEEHIRTCRIKNSLPQDCLLQMGHLALLFLMLEMFSKLYNPLLLPLCYVLPFNLRIHHLFHSYLKFLTRS